MFNILFKYSWSSNTYSVWRKTYHYYENSKINNKKFKCSMILLTKQNWSFKPSELFQTSEKLKNTCDGGY